MTVGGVGRDTGPEGTGLKPAYGGKAP